MSNDMKYQGSAQAGLRNYYCSCVLPLKLTAALSNVGYGESSILFSGYQQGRQD